MQIDKTIYLVGYMGSGKTSLGPFLAIRLKIPFYDLDRMIEKEEGMSSAQVFDTQGEAHFREVEQKLLSTLNGPMVVACGGGTFCKPENREIMEAKGIVIHLKVQEKTLINRLTNEINARPLLSQHKDKWREFLGQHLKERTDNCYKYAQIVIDAEGMPPGDIVKTIVQKLGEHKESLVNK
ncbi:MAG: shikimate kinase [Luteibaculaceae bacterium]